MENANENSLKSRQKEEAIARMKLLGLPGNVIDAFSTGQICHLKINGDQYEILKDEEIRQKVTALESQNQATVFLVATIFVEWLSQDKDVLVFVDSNDKQWESDRKKISEGYTWVHALSDSEEETKYLEGHIDTDVLLSLKVWQKKTAVSWLKKMQVPQYVIDDFAATGQVYVTSTYEGEFRKPNAILKKQIAAFEKRRNALVYLVVYRSDYEWNFLAYVTGNRSGDGVFMEQQDAVLGDSLNVYRLSKGDGYFDEYCESNLRFARQSDGKFDYFIERW